MLSKKHTRDVRDSRQALGNMSRTHGIGSASKTIYKYKRRPHIPPTPMQPIPPRPTDTKPYVYFQLAEYAIYSSLAPPRPAFSAAAIVFLS